MAAPIELQFPVDDRSREAWHKSDLARTAVEPCCGTEVNRRKLRIRFGLGFKAMDALDMLLQQTDYHNFERE